MKNKHVINDHSLVINVPRTSYLVWWKWDCSVVYRIFLLLISNLYTIKKWLVMMNYMWWEWLLAIKILILIEIIIFVRNSKLRLGNFLILYLRFQIMRFTTYVLYVHTWWYYYVHRCTLVCVSKKIIYGMLSYLIKKN